MEEDNKVPGIDDSPITYEQAVEMVRKTVERVHAREALKRVQAANPAERAVV